MSSNVFSEVFYTFLITSTIGFLLAVIKACYKSKCTEISCGCIKIVRDTNNEEKIDEIQLQNHGTSSRDTENNNNV